MDLLPHEFYDMEHEDYFLKRKGFFSRRVYEQRVWRKAVAIQIAPWIKNPPDEFRLWPLDGDKELKELYKNERISVSEDAMERLRKFKELEASQKPKDN